MWKFRDLLEDVMVEYPGDSYQLTLELKKYLDQLMSGVGHYMNKELKGIQSGWSPFVRATSKPMSSAIISKHPPNARFFFTAKYTVAREVLNDITYLSFRINKYLEDAIEISGFSTEKFMDKMERGEISLAHDIIGRHIMPLVGIAFFYEFSPDTSSMKAVRYREDISLENLDKDTNKLVEIVKRYMGFDKLLAEYIAEEGPASSEVRAAVKALHRLV